MRFTFFTSMLLALFMTGGTVAQRLDRQIKKSIGAEMQAFQEIDTERAVVLNKLAREIAEENASGGISIQFSDSSDSGLAVLASIWFRSGMLYRGFSAEGVQAMRTGEDALDATLEKLEPYGFELVRDTNENEVSGIDFGTGNWLTSDGDLFVGDTSLRDHRISILLNDSSASGEDSNALVKEIRTREDMLARDILYLAFRVSNLMELD